MENWETRSKLYDKLDWTNRQQYIEKVIKACNLKSWYHVSDVGTGTGPVASSIAPYCDKITAFDISPSMINVARSKHLSENIEFIVMNAEDSKFQDNTFDCTVARMCFHHIDNDHKAINECYRTLKPNGIFVISEGIPPLGTRKDYEGIFKLKEKRRVYILDDLVDLVESAGFQDIAIDIHRMKSVSTNNWLKNSGLPESQCKKIYQYRLDSQEYIKEVYNMKVHHGDIYMDWLFAIVSGRKQNG